LLCSLVILLPLARGGVDATTEEIALAIAFAATLLATWSFSRLPRAAVALALVVAVIALQLVPFPPSLHALSPATRSVFELSLAPLGRYPAARPFTLDVPATARELGKASACLLSFVAASTFSATRRRKSRLLVAIAASAGVISLAVLTGALVGLGPFLAPTFPFVNRNHLAGFLNLTSFAALGRALRQRGPTRPLWAIVFTGSATVLFASTSRAGVAAFVLGLTIFIARFAWAHRTSTGRWRLFVLGGVTCVALAAAALVALAPLVAKFRAMEESPQDLKIKLWPAGVRVMRDYPITGIGRGAFMTVFPAYREDTSAVTFSHLENEELQVIIDLGLPGGLLLTGTLALIWLATVRRTDLSPPEIGLLAGSAALAFQVLFDFSTEVLGVAVPLSVATGLLVRDRHPVRLPPVLLRAMLAILFVAGTAGLAIAHARPDDVASVANRATPSEVQSAATTAVAWRPADYLPQAVAGASLASAGRCREAIPWLQRAMVLGPMVPDPHLHAGRCLAASGASEAARREFRLACLLGQPNCLAEAAVRWPALADLYQVAPDTPDGLLALGAALERDRPIDAREVYARALNEFAESRAVLPLARVALALGDVGHAVELARRRIREAPLDGEAYWLVTRGLDAQGKRDEAEAELRRALATSAGSTTLVALLSERLLAGARYDEVLDLARTISGHEPRDVAARERLTARALAGEKRLSEAIEHARYAADAVPGSPDSLLELAQLCIAAERYEDALAILERASALPDVPTGAYERQIAEVRARIAARDARWRAEMLLDTSP
jgi:tetratricopeptide (TPR) repeat protein/O-antigen ligase